jgi:hypothetical protein
MTRPFRSILAGTLAAASLVAAVPAAHAAYSQPDPNEPIICVRCGALTPIQLPGWVVNPPIKPVEIGAVARP